MTYEEALAYWYSHVNWEQRTPGSADLGLERSARPAVARLGNPHHSPAHRPRRRQQGQRLDVRHARRHPSECGLSHGTVHVAAPVRAGRALPGRWQGTSLPPSPTVLLEEIRGSHSRGGRPPGTPPPQPPCPKRRGGEAGSPLSASGRGLGGGVLRGLGGGVLRGLGGGVFSPARLRPSSRSRRRWGSCTSSAAVQTSPSSKWDSAAGNSDSTNVCTPLVSIITSISFDHTAILGDRLASISREKAGIVKPHRPVISGATAEESRAVIESVCARQHAPLQQLSIDFHYQNIPGRVTGTAIVRPQVDVSTRSCYAGRGWT